MKVFRHGDVVLFEVKEIPNAVKDKDTNILAEGEFTGHKHELVTKEKVIFQDVEGNLYVDLKQQTKLVHQEHNTIVLPATKYRVLIKRNYNPFQKRIEEVRD